MKTKAQQDLILAEELVTSVLDHGNGVAKIYGGLCHSFPVLVRTCGLCQAVAFSKDKASGGKERGKAHELLLAHLGKLLDVEDPLVILRQATAVEYMLHTRRVLAAWIYFKRFAVSILKAEAGSNNDKP